MSDTPGYGFISPSHIDNLTKELAKTKARIAELEELLKRCIPMLNSLDGELSMDLADWEDPTGERSKAREAERLECNNLMDEVRGAL